MKRKLWKKQWKLNELLEEFETKDDLELDQRLTKYDILGTLAHTYMLKEINVLEEKEFQTIKAQLYKIFDKDQKGKFELEFGDEDIHTKIENYLVKELGDTGKKVHTGRSRNDQVLTATRLYTKDTLQDIWNNLITISKSFSNFAKKYEYVPMPGYTHMQKAMPTSIGMWGTSFVESFFDDIRTLKNAYEINDKSPLGTAAGFGVPLNLDRELTAKLLGFKRIQVNSLYTQNSRGKIEAGIIASLISILQTINKFATDVMMYTTDEFDYLTVDDSLCSGSSIMPQKRNVDIAELLRSKVHLILGEYTKMVSMSSNLISGYNRDLQDSKKVLFESLTLTNDCIKIANLLINNISPNVENLKKGITGEILATHKVIKLVQEGMPFREAYDKISHSAKDLSAEDVDYEALMRDSTHLGATGNLTTDKIIKKVDREAETLEKEKQKFKEKIDNLLNL